MLLLLPVVAGTVGLGGCGGKGGNPQPTAASLTAEGWQAYEAGDRVAADARFQDALALDATYADAHTGRGWIAVTAGDVDTAAALFETALARTEIEADGGIGPWVPVADVRETEDAFLVAVELLHENRRGILVAILFAIALDVLVNVDDHTLEHHRRIGVAGGFKEFGEGGFAFIRALSVVEGRGQVRERARISSDLLGVLCVFSERSERARG